ncbi:uncharacterized protein CcaverHIS019_0202630 [Cutaneotrichosporon cavernicola]|uniref:Uncharacterized protein n=1 Tax=Cutaneotrichosporon cavernicola TaxID=279322 RepID=A0AA48I0K0_9TREE|nr:uncharacterized protein CcaverHIS019_0202630 [Cutaneotrichosporon cavernicola]BEI88901.1 hypothetical protein CcaverHIS019_0202630 [Cutaneotrichosporon cavernicola]BEI96678.1 hypothetical protein CcaverHIS631_0202670 [Cutaneotrichosporon cavernicola]BEJ04450.1 hypothetical protein CcaverHIS641_0202670 [Cutaneotrichosporon cavernicola]
MRTALLAASLFPVVYAHADSTSSAGAPSVDFFLAADGSGMGPGAVIIGGTHRTQAIDDVIVPGPVVNVPHPNHIPVVVDPTAVNDPSTIVVTVDPTPYDTSITMGDMTWASFATGKTTSYPSYPNKKTTRSPTATSVPPLAASAMAPFATASWPFASPFPGISDSKVPAWGSSFSVGPTAATAAGHIPCYNDGAIGFALLGAALFAF